MLEVLYEPISSRESYAFLQLFFSFNTAGLFFAFYVHLDKFLG